MAGPEPALPLSPALEARVLDLCRPFEPALRLVCQRWRTVVDRSGTRQSDGRVRFGFARALDWLAQVVAAGDHLALLQWARRAGCPWDEQTCAFAARGG